MSGEAHEGAHDLACEVCGQVPGSRRRWLSAGRLAALLSVQWALSALVLGLSLPGWGAALLLAITTTVLVVGVVEPSALRLLAKRLRAPVPPDAGELRAAEFLWRVRVTLADRPGALEAVTHELTRLGLSILTLHVHPLQDGVLDEIVLGGDASVRSGDLSEAVRRGGGREVRVWPTTALSLIDGQTRALNLAARVARQPEELPGAVAELLGAGLITDRLMAPARPARAGIADETVLRIPSPWSGLFAFQRPDSPFTPAERARAVRLAEIAASTTLAQRGPASPVHEDPAIPRSG